MNYEYIKLNSICTLKQWKTIAKKDLKETGYPVYGANGIIGYTDKYNHTNKTVMICCRGASCGCIHMSTGPCYINGNAMCLDNLSKDYLPDFIKLYLEHYDFLKVISGTAQPQITQQGLNKVNVPILLIKEQTETINKINCYKKEIHLLNRLKQILDELVKSRFIEMFGNIIDTVEIRTLVDTKKISAKKTFKEDDLIKYVDISSIDNKNNIITNYTDYIFSESPSRAQQVLKKNDILISTVRPNLKNVALFKEDGLNFVGSSGFCVLRSTKVNYNYLLYNVIQDEFTNKMISLTTGASYPAIRDENILSYKIKNAPVELQNEFAEFVQLIDKSKLIVQKQIDLFQELLDKKMAEYFDI